MQYWQWAIVIAGAVFLVIGIALKAAQKGGGAQKQP
jgi:hypothetical protein